MKRRQTLSILFFSTTLLLIGSSGIVPHPASSQSNTPPIQTPDVELGLAPFNTAMNTLEDKLRQWEQELQRDGQYQSTIDLKNFADEFKNLKPLADKNQNTDIEKLAQNEILIALSNMRSIQSNNSDELDSVRTLQEVLKDSGEDLPETGIYAARTNSALLNALIQISKRQLNSNQTLPPSVQESNATVSNLIDGNLNWLAIAAAIGALLSLGANLLLFVKVQKLQRLRPSGELTSTSNSEDLFRKQVKIIKDDIKTLTDKQTSLEQQLRQQTQQRAAALEQREPTPQGYGSRESSSRYGQSPISPAQPPYNRPDYASEKDQSSRSWKESAQASSPALMSPYAMIVQNYNANPSAIASNAQGVSETEESVVSRRSHGSKRVALKSISNYSYWIIADAENNYWLTPKPDLRLNPMNFDTFQVLFEFQGLPFEGKLSLLKPAKVILSNAPDEWELIEHGEVQFI